MRLFIKSTTSLLILAFLISAFQVPTKLQKKVKKEIINVFEIESFTLENISVSNQVNQQLPIAINTTNFHKIIVNSKCIGYAFLEKAPSKTAEFDYLILLDNSGTIVKSKVLIYREEYGGEIGSTRWLKQFIGIKSSQKLTYKNEIDAISGATISVKSMIRSVNDVLKTVHLLKENKII